MSSSHSLSSLVKFKKESILLFVLAAVQFTHIVDFMIMMPLGDILQRELDISPLQFSILVAAYPVAAFLSSLFGVFYLDRWDRRTALLVAYCGFVIGTLSSAIIPTTDIEVLNYFLFIATRVLTGLFGGIIGALVLAIIGDVFTLEKRGRAMGIVMTAFSLAAVLGVPIALQLVNWFDGNWHMPFLMVGAVGIPIIALVFFKVDSMRKHIEVRDLKPHPYQTIKRAIGSANQQQALLFTVLLVLGQFTVIPFVTPYMINNVGLTQEQIPLIYLIGGACTSLSSPLVGRLVDKFGRKKVFYGMAGFSTIPLILITNLWPMPIALVLTVTAIFFIGISGRMIPANTLMTAVVKTENRGGFMSLNSSVSSLAAGGASVIAGSIIVQAEDHAPLENYNWVGYLAVFCTLIAIFLAYRLVEQKETPIEPASSPEQ